MNFSLSEIIVILLIALLVIKPEQLPELAFTLGQWIRMVRRLGAKWKGDISGWMDSLEQVHERQRKH